MQLKHYAKYPIAVCRIIYDICEDNAKPCCEHLGTRYKVGRKISWYGRMPFIVLAFLVNPKWPARYGWIFEEGYVVTGNKNVAQDIVNMHEEYKTRQK